MSNTKHGRLTTHVLDTAKGCPAAGLAITLYRIEGETLQLIKKVTTNADGRCDSPLLEGDAFQTGEYELVFEVGGYLKQQGTDLPEPSFLNLVPIRFGMAEQAHYHVPLLVSPYGYSTYRGS